MKIRKNENRKKMPLTWCKSMKGRKEKRRRKEVMRR